MGIKSIGIGANILFWGLIWTASFLLFYWIADPSFLSSREFKEFYSISFLISNIVGSTVFGRLALPRNRESDWESFLLMTVTFWTVFWGIIYLLLSLIVYGYIYEPYRGGEYSSEQCESRNPVCILIWAVSLYALHWIDLPAYFAIAPVVSLVGGILLQLTVRRWLKRRL